MTLLQIELLSRPCVIRRLCRTMSSSVRHEPAVPVGYGDIAPCCAVGYCARIATRDITVNSSSTLLMRVIKAHARWRWRA